MPSRTSEKTAFTRCRRKWHLGSVQGWYRAPSLGRRMPLSGKRDMGTVVHAGLLNEGGWYGTELDMSLDDRAWWEEEMGLTLDDPVHSMVWAANKTLQELRNLGAEEHGEEIPPLTKEEDKEWWDVWRYAKTMLEGYAEWVTDEGTDVGIKVLGTEIEMTYGDDQGHLDMAVEDELLQAVVIEDFKTVDSLTKTPEDTDFQLWDYAYLYWKTTGTLPGYVSHRMIRKNLRTKGEAGGPYFGRHLIKVTPAKMAKFEAERDWRIQEMDALRRLPTEHPAIYPNPMTGTCSWDCDFRDVCPTISAGRDWVYTLEQTMTRSTDSE